MFIYSFEFSSSFITCNWIEPEGKFGENFPVRKIIIGQNLQSWSDQMLLLIVVLPLHWSFILLSPIFFKDIFFHHARLVKWNWCKIKYRAVLSNTIMIFEKIVILASLLVSIFWWLLIMCSLALLKLLRIKTSCRIASFRFTI